MFKENSEEKEKKQENVTPLKIEIAPMMFVGPEFQKACCEKFGGRFNGRPNWFLEEVEKASDWTLNKKPGGHKDCEAFLRNWFRKAAEDYTQRVGQGRARKNYKEILK